MKFPIFEVEQWMTNYEQEAVYNLTDTCVSPLSMHELLRLDTSVQLNDIVLDYGAITGKIQLKKAISALYKTGDETTVAISQGCLQANEMVMHTLLESGDTVLTFVPGYQQFIEIPKALGCTVISIPLKEENGWLPDWKDITSAFEKKPKLLIINNPNNPTGTSFMHSFLLQLCELAEEYGTYILADEVYQGLAEDEVRISDIYTKGISTGSLSKVYSLAGLRLGWIHAAKDIIETINYYRDYSIISIGDLVETLGCIALEQSDAILSRNKTLVQQNKHIIQEWLNQEPRAQLVMPKAGTVGFLKYDMKQDSKTVALELLKRYGVFFVPGACFGCEHHLRIGFTTSAEKLSQGLSYVSQYFDEIA